MVESHNSSIVFSRYTFLLNLQLWLVKWFGLAKLVPKGYSRGAIHLRLKGTAAESKSPKKNYNRLKIQTLGRDI